MQNCPHIIKPPFLKWVGNCFLLFLLLFSPAHAEDGAKELDKKEHQEVTDDSDNFITFVFENDSIGSGTDQNYTNGVRLTYLDLNAAVPDFFYKVTDYLPILPDYLPTFDKKNKSTVYYSAGQNLYTPDDIGSPVQDPNDRPWAGFIYGSIGIFTETENYIDEMEVTFGIVGPLALGRQIQTIVHRHVTNSTIPEGWDNQLENEPGLILSWQRRWSDALPMDGLKISETKKLRLSVDPYFGISLGNIYTYASAGFSFRISTQKSRSSNTPLRVRPALPGTGYFRVSEEGWGWSLFGGIEGRAVARNIFLDGSTFVSSHNVTKYPVVGDANLGIAFDVSRVRLSYTLVLRSKEFKTQDRSDLFGAVSLAYRF